MKKLYMALLEIWRQFHMSFNCNFFVKSVMSEIKTNINVKEFLETNKSENM